jgi:hypothetical protein
MRTILALLLLVAAPLAAQSPAAPPSDADVRQLGDRMTRWLLAGQSDSVFAHMSGQLRERIGGRDGVAEAAAELIAELGAETAVHMQSVTRGNGAPEYWRLSSFSLVDDEPLVFHWMFDTAGAATGLGVSPLSDTPPAD